jgi:hypothetical protein
MKWNRRYQKGDQEEQTKGPVCHGATVATAEWQVKVRWQSFAKQRPSETG